MPADNRILWGATSSPQTLAQAASFDTLVGTRASLVQMFWSMQQQGQFTPFPVAIADALWQRGQIYVHTWGTWDWQAQVNWTSADIVAGKYDAYFHAEAKRIATWRHPLFVRLDHEFNGNWAPWHTDPKSFVALWRHIVALFRGDGASNITWVWCPTYLTPLTAKGLASYYPGDDVVDWTGFDTYNGAASHGEPWLPLGVHISGNAATASWIADTYGTVAAIAPTKPMGLWEFGCVPGGGNRPAWLTDALAVLPTQYPLIRALSYHHAIDGSSAWSLLASDGSAAAYAAGLRAGPYTVAPLVMPPDLQPIQPLQVATSWGDPFANLNAQVTTTTTQLATATTQLVTATTQHATDTASLAAAATLHTSDAALIATGTTALAAATQSLADAQAQITAARTAWAALIAAVA